MKNKIPLFIVLGLGLAGSALAQEPAGTRRLSQVNAPPEPTFDVKFEGGTPAQLVKAIDDQAGVKVNLFIPTELAATQLSPVTMHGVTASQLFQAISMASFKTVSMFSEGQYRTHREGVLIQPVNVRGDSPVWYFMVDGPPTVKIERVRPVRYFHLGKYLETYTIDDISTAIRTGWKMADHKAPANELQLDFSEHGPDEPLLNFHRETKLLIAVGEPARLRLIDETLAELAKGLNPSVAPANPSPIPSPSPAPKPPEPKPVQP